VTDRLLSDAGASIAVHHLTSGGAPVLLVHATGFHGRVWRPVAELLDGFSSIAPDLRGHGDSAPQPTEDFDWHGFADDVLAVVTRLGLGLGRPLRAAGHSSGATALLLAEQARPGTFGALYCFEPIIVPADPPLGPDRDNWLARSTRRRRAVFRSREEAWQRFAARPPLSELDPTALAAYVEHGLADLAAGGVGLKCEPEHEALMYEMASANDCFGRLPEVRCQVTLAYGGRSEAFLPDRRQAVASRLPRVVCAEHPALGHLGPLEDPAAVAGSIRRALIETTSVN
jgi:pimeloyl-ACP methyl ester carboxylesterase